MSVDPLRYANTEKAQEKTDFNAEYAFLKMRYKLPSEDTSKLITKPVSADMGSANSETYFASAVAAFGQILKGGQYTGNFSYDDVIALAKKGKGEDDFGYRSEFINLVRFAKSADEMQ